MFQPGTVIQERYQILNLLGQGGFSQTYAVDDQGTTKVLKVLLENYPKAIHLFQREAKVLSQLHHPGIPSVEPDGYFTVQQESSNDRLHCLVMELIPGGDLRQWLSDRNNQPVTNDQAINWLQQMVEILSQIHRHQCFHRDIKPSNIMLRPNGQLALIDFGAVREVTETYLQKCEEDITRTHVYSRGYTPIEQMQGRAVPESDFFALGRTFVHLMTGHNPLEFSIDANTGRLLWRDQAPYIVPALAELMDCLMAPFPGQRPRNLNDIQAALAEIEADPELDYTTEGTVLFKLLRHQRSGSTQLPNEEMSILGTLPLEDGVGDVEFTQPPEDDSLITLDSPVGMAAPSKWQSILQRVAGWPIILACSLLATGSVVGLRVAGVFQQVELQALDVFLQNRLPEQIDKRILIVTIDEEDLTFQTESGMTRQGSLADEALFQLLEMLTPHAPRVIGLDIYREATQSGTTSSTASYPDSLASQSYLQKYSDLVVVCSVGGSDSGYAAIEPPPSVSLDQVGFSDVPVDSDGRVRRHIIGMTPAEHCNTQYSLSYQLASRYLAQSDVEVSADEEQVLLFGDRSFPPLSNYSGGYNQGNLGGYELLLNYRQTHDVGHNVAQMVSLREMLDGTFTQDLDSLVGDRVVLIGTTATSFGDYHMTPYGEMAGIIIQAHMVSQILSAVLDQRPLLWMWPSWGDALWILGWVVISGGVAWVGRSRWIVLISTGGLMGVVVVVSYGIILIGGWMPLIPSVAAMVLATAGIRTYKAALTTEQSRYHSKPI